MQQNEGFSGGRLFLQEVAIERGPKAERESVSSTSPFKNKLGCALFWLLSSFDSLPTSKYAISVAKVTGLGEIPAVIVQVPRS